MDETALKKLPLFLQILGLEEEPMGVFYTDETPAQGYTPKPLDLPTRQKEQENSIDWGTIFGTFSCVIGNIWRARRKNSAAYFDSERFGCPGGAFFLGFLKPQTETIIHYVSTGIPDIMKGELYCDSPDELRRIFEYIDPRPAPLRYCVVKPLSLFTTSEEPELILFFCRPEAMCGLHQLVAFVTHDPESVVSPWGAACTNLITWPFHYMEKGLERAVLGGWDPSARKFFKTDELSLSVPFHMFLRMLDRFQESFLTTGTWETVQKKIARSKKAWGEGKSGRK